MGREVRRKVERREGSKEAGEGVKKDGRKEKWDEREGWERGKKGG